MHKHRHTITLKKDINSICLFRTLAEAQRSIELTDESLWLSLACRRTVFCDMFHMDPTTVCPLQENLLLGHISKVWIKEERHIHVTPLQ